MAGFFACIELHEGDQSDYHELHKQMSNKDFFNSWKLGGGSFELPPGTYFGLCPGKTLSQVHTDVIQAATSAKFPPDPVNDADSDGTPGTCAIAIVGVNGARQSGLNKA
jgi:hypothetical protein